MKRLSFPNTGDAASLRETSWQDESPILARMVGTPRVGLIHLGAPGSMSWLDLVCGVGVAARLPRALLR